MPPGWPRPCRPPPDEDSPRDRRRRARSTRRGVVRDARAGARRTRPVPGRWRLRDGRPERALRAGRAAGARWAVPRSAYPERGGVPVSVLGIAGALAVLAALWLPEPRGASIRLSVA